MILIKNARILTMAGKEYENGCVLIEKSTIAEVAESIDEGNEQITEIIDAQGGWVMPGLIEAHCHIGITEERKGFEGNDNNEMTQPLTPYLRALDGINPMDSAFANAVSAGITGVMVGPGSSNVVGGQFAFIKTYGRSIEDMIVLEPAAMKIAFGENPKSNYDNKGMMPSTRMAIAALLREELLEAELYCNDRRENACSKQFRSECWMPVFDNTIPLKAHVHRADDILTAIRIAKEFKLDITLDHCTEGHLIADKISNSGFPAIIGPSMSSRNKVETQYMDFKTAGELYKHGVKVAITTDHPVTRIQYLPICAGFAAKEGLGIEEGLKAITINAAQICKVSDKLGSLEVGKDADIAIFNGNPMEVFTTALYTIINGEVVYRHKE